MSHRLYCLIFFMLGHLTLIPYCRRSLIYDYFEHCHSCLLMFCMTLLRSSELLKSLSQFWIHSCCIVTWERVNWKSMSAFTYRAFSGLNYTVVGEQPSMWFVCAGVNTVIALGCGPEQKKRISTPPRFKCNENGIRPWLFFFFLSHCLLFKLSFN